MHTDRLLRFTESKYRLWSFWKGGHLRDVAPVQTLDLYNLGAHVSQPCRAVRSGQSTAKVDYPDSLE